MRRRTCVLFDAHRFDDYTRHNLVRVRAECGGAADVHLIYSGCKPLPADIASAPWAHAWDPVEAIASGPKTIPHSREEILGDALLRAMNSETKALKLIAAADPSYDLFVRMEYDVWSAIPYGAIVRVIEAAMRGRAFAAFYLRSRASDPTWYWWHQPMRWPPGLAAPDLAALVCLFAITREAADAVARVYAGGVAGHHEVALPSALLAAGYGLSDLCSLERLFCADAPAASRERRYKGPFNPHAAEFAPNCHLFHAVKTLEQAEALRAMHAGASPLSGGAVDAGLRTAQ
jgi:hypothetical protein